MKGVISCCRELLVVWVILTGTYCVSVQPVWNISCSVAYLTWMHNKSGVAVRRNQMYCLVQGLLWGLWWTKWYWFRVFSEYFGFTVTRRSTNATYSLIRHWRCVIVTVYVVQVTHFACSCHCFSSCRDIELSLLIFQVIFFSAKISNTSDEAFYGFTQFLQADSAIISPISLRGLRLKSFSVLHSPVLCRSGV